MYRAVRLADDQKDLLHFLWKENLRQPFQHYRMTRLTFGVSASSFLANMVLRQSAIEHLENHPQEAQVALDCVYVDDDLMGANSTHEVQLRRELHDLFDQEGFKLQKWKSSEGDVLTSIPEDLNGMKGKQEIHHKDVYIKVLGVEWNVVSDSFRPVISCYKDSEPLTKRVLVSNIARLLMF